MRYQTEAQALVSALDVRRWPFYRVEAALDWVCALEHALFEARRDEFVRAELRATSNPLPDSFHDDDIPF